MAISGLCQTLLRARMIIMPFLASKQDIGHPVSIDDKPRNSVRALAPQSQFQGPQTFSPVVPSLRFAFEEPINIDLLLFEQFGDLE